MPVSLTEKEFSRHLNTKFRASVDGDQALDLELTEVTGYPGTPAAKARMERFSAFFLGPLEPRLPQKSFTFKHDQMGEFEVFIVPVGRNDKGITYEAVFNYFKEQ